MTKTSREARVIKQLRSRESSVETRTPLGTDIYAPNHSGDHSAGKVFRTPVNDYDIINKKYVDDNSYWLPSDNDIYYNAGNVGIGGTPAVPLHLITTGSTPFRLERTGVETFSWVITGANPNSYLRFDSSDQTDLLRIMERGDIVIPGGNFTTTKNQNAVTYSKLSNNNTGTASQTYFQLNNNNVNTYLGLGGSGFTTSAYLRQNGTWLQNTGAGLDLAASGASGTINFWTGGANERATIDENGNVGIGTSSPNAAAALDIVSTTKGFKLPNMSSTQRDAISSPPAGLMIYNSTTNKLNFYNGSAWEAVTSA